MVAKDTSLLAAEAEAQFFTKMTFEAYFSISSLQKKPYLGLPAMNFLQLSMENCRRHASFAVLNVAGFNNKYFINN